MAGQPGEITKNRVVQTEQNALKLTRAVGRVGIIVDRELTGRRQFGFEEKDRGLVVKQHRFSTCKIM